MVRQVYLLHLRAGLNVGHFVDDQIDGWRKLCPHDTHDVFVKNAKMWVLGAVDNAARANV